LLHGQATLCELSQEVFNTEGTEETESEERKERKEKVGQLG
jgi:hypothetical protein